MPTTFNDQFYSIDPAAPPPLGTALTFSRFDLIDNNDDGDIDRFNGDSVNGQDVTRSWAGDTITVNVPGVGNVTYTGTTFYLADGSRAFTPTDGQILANGTLVGTTFVTSEGPLFTDDLPPPCFTPGTQIETDQGARLIETLTPGTMIRTLDNGFQPLVAKLSRIWVGQDHGCPVRFMPNALGAHGELIVSPQHRMLLRGWRAELLFGEPEVLVPAKHLINGDMIHAFPMERVTYIHLLMDRHEIIHANGCLTESFDLGCDFALYDTQLSAFLRRGIKGRLPGGRASTVRRVLTAREARALAA